MQNYTREIITNLPNEKKYCEMIASVVGQLSDGIWENSNRAIGYWVYAECHSGRNNIHVSELYYDSYHRCRNPYRRMDDKAIKKYFATKIKQIALIEMEDEYKEKIRKEIFGDLNWYLIPKDRYDEWKEKENKYYEYLRINPFEKKGKFKPSDYEISYLGYDEHITLADCYNAYQILTH